MSFQDYVVGQEEERLTPRSTVFVSLGVRLARIALACARVAFARVAFAMLACAALASVGLVCLLSERALAQEVAPRSTCRGDMLVREELHVQTADGYSIFVMAVAAPRSRGAVVLTHGAGSASSAIWDLLHEDYSMMRRLACAGFDAYALDARGFGGSTLPASLLAPSEAGPPASRAKEVMADVEAVVRLAQQRSQVTQVALLGWSWGSEVAGMYASLHPLEVKQLVLFAPVYDRKWPTRHVKHGAWRNLHKSELFKFFDSTTDDRAVLEELADGIFRFSGGDTIRLPNGPYRDIFGDDAPCWRAKNVRADTLIIRGDRDLASTRESVEHLHRDLVSARTRRILVIEGAGHFAFRAQGHRELQEAIIHFLNQSG